MHSTSWMLKDKKKKKRGNWYSYSNEKFNEPGSDLLYPLQFTYLCLEPIVLAQKLPLYIKVWF